jgi:DNA-binding response OmpR family regulator
MTTWMIVEDEPDLHEMLFELITGIGHNVLGFSTGEDAVNWLDQVDDGLHSDEIPELALFDIRLPGQISGPDVAVRLRKSTIVGRIVIVMMTAYRLTPDEELAIMNYATPDMMLYKPLPDFPEFRRRLEDLLM